MPDTQTLDKAYQLIMSHLVETGQSTHYSDLVAGLRCSTEEGLQVVHDLEEVGPASIRLIPDTDWSSGSKHPNFDGSIEITT